MSSVFALASRGCSIAFRHTPPTVKPPGMNCVKQFFVSKENHLARFSRLSAGVDKALKFTISTLEFSKLMTQRFDPTSASLSGLSAAHAGIRDARSVLGLFNTFQGAIPGMVSSVKLCNQLVHDLRNNYQATSLTKSILMTTECHLQESQMPEHRYNQIAFGRRQQISKAVESACNAIGGGTFAFTFATLRPLMLVNQYEKFLSSSQLSSVGLAADAIMCVNHIVGVGSAVASLVFEESAFATARAAIMDQSNSESHLQLLNIMHRTNLSNSSLTLVEKSLELSCDILKLVPACVVAVPKEVRAGIGVFIGILGLYKIWRTS